MSIDATVRITWNPAISEANSVMKDAFSRSNPFEFISGVLPESHEERFAEWGVPFEPRQVIQNKPGIVEFDLALGAPTEIFLDLANGAPDGSNFRMFCLTDCGGFTANGYFRTSDGQLGKVDSPVEADFSGTIDELWDLLAKVTDRYAELELEGPLDRD